MSLCRASSRCTVHCKLTVHGAFALLCWQAVGGILGDERARTDLFEGLEGAALLSRRVGALVLRRAAERASATPGLPDAARDAIVSTNTALAEAIAPEADAMD